MGRKKIHMQSNLYIIKDFEKLSSKVSKICNFVTLFLHASLMIVGTYGRTELSFCGSLFSRAVVSLASAFLVDVIL